MTISTQKKFDKIQFLFHNKKLSSKPGIGHLFNLIEYEPKNLLLSCRSSLFILDINSLSDTCFANIFYIFLVQLCFSHIYSFGEAPCTMNEDFGSKQLEFRISHLLANQP